MNRRAAFTLLELLTVLAIIAVLASLVLAAITLARRKARDIQCQSHLRQHAVAVHGFVADHGAYPLWMDEPVGLTDRCFARVLLQTFGKMHPWRYDYRGDADTVYACPAAIRLRVPPEVTHLDHRFPGTHYGYNIFGLGGRSPHLGLGGGGVTARGGCGPPPVGEAEVKVPSQMIAVGDDVAGWNDVFEDGRFGRIASATEYYGSTPRAKLRHQGKLNIGFCDGHVEALTLQTLFSDRTDTALRLWNRDHLPHRERLQ